MLVDTAVATAAAYALDKSRGNPFEGLAATDGQVDVPYAQGANVKTQIDPATGAVGFQIGYPIKGQGYTTETIYGRAAVDWAATIPALPATGTVTQGYYRYGDEICYVIQPSFSRTTWGGDPFQAGYESLCRLFRNPWRVYPWKQPIDQYDAWKTANAITGAADQCIFGGHLWQVAEGDGGGNNVWQPGVFGWTDIGAAP